jgi:uncharacterized protein YacL
MKKVNFAQNAIVTYFIVLLFSGLIAAVPPGRLVFYLLMFGLAIIPLWVGPFRFRIYGIILVLIALLLCVIEIRDGIRHQNQMEQLRNRFTQNQVVTNSSPDSRQP